MSHPYKSSDIGLLSLSMYEPRDVARSRALQVLIYLRSWGFDLYSNSLTLCICTVIIIKSSFHERTKHDKVDQFFLKDKIAQGLLSTPYTFTLEKLENIFTKGLMGKSYVISWAWSTSMVLFEREYEERCVHGCNYLLYFGCCSCNHIGPTYFFVCRALSL